VPGISSSTADWIYHIFWDLIGFPTALFSLYFLIRAINCLLKLRFSRLSNWITISLILLLTILSYAGIYFRLQEMSSIFGEIVWTVYFYIIPLLQLGFLALAYYQSTKLEQKNSSVGKFLLILFFSFSGWHFLSLAPIYIGVWRHLIILTYYLALFLPTVYLYLFIKKKSSGTNPGNLENVKLEGIFTTYKFTAREKELLFLLLEGKSNKEISKELFISLQTVKNYVSKIYKKIGLKNRLELVNFIQKYSGNKLL